MVRDGRQRKARYERLRAEIIDYVQGHPGCTANQIVAALAVDRGLKNHGLTPRKVGFFIPRNCAEFIRYEIDRVSGKRLYLPIE